MIKLESILHAVSFQWDLPCPCISEVTIHLLGKQYIQNCLTLFPNRKRNQGIINVKVDTGTNVVAEARVRVEVNEDGCMDGG